MQSTVLWTFFYRQPQLQGVHEYGRQIMSSLSIIILLLNGFCLHFCDIPWIFNRCTIYVWPYSKYFGPFRSLYINHCSLHIETSLTKTWVVLIYKYKHKYLVICLRTCPLAKQKQLAHSQNLWSPRPWTFHQVYSNSSPQIWPQH